MFMYSCLGYIVVILAAGDAFMNHVRLIKVANVQKMIECDLLLKSQENREF